MDFFGNISSLVALVTPEQQGTPLPERPTDDSDFEGSNFEHGAGQAKCCVVA
jgi:hypothetical protein